MVKAQRHASSDLKHDGSSGDWFFDVNKGGGYLIEQSVHNLDACNWVIGAHPTRACGFGGILLYKNDPPGRTIFDCGLPDLRVSRRRQALLHAERVSARGACPAAASTSTFTGARAGWTCSAAPPCILPRGAGSLRRSRRHQGRGRPVPAHRPVLRVHPEGREKPVGHHHRRDGGAHVHSGPPGHGEGDRGQVERYGRGGVAGAALMDAPRGWRRRVKARASTPKPGPRPCTPFRALP